MCETIVSHRNWEIIVDYSRSFFLLAVDLQDKSEIYGKFPKVPLFPTTWFYIFIISTFPYFFYISFSCHSYLLRSSCVIFSINSLRPSRTRKYYSWYVHFFFAFQLYFANKCVNSTMRESSIQILFWVLNITDFLSYSLCWYHITNCNMEGTMFNVI